MVEKAVIEIIREFVNVLMKEGIHVHRAILYGSYVKGKPRRESDIDVAIISNDFGRDTTEEGMNLFRIAGGIDPRLEPVPISVESYENDTWIPLIYEIRKKGLEVKIGK